MNTDHMQDREGAARWRRRAAYASIAVALTLIAVKLATYLSTGSVSILSSLIDSSVDALASVVTLLGVAQALTPPDAAHRFGHGKAEPLAALAQSAFITGSAVFLGYEAIGRLVDPRPVDSTGLGIAVMVFAIVMTAGLVTFQRWVIERTGSIAIDADSLHYRGDLLMNLAVIAALVLTRVTGSGYWDPLFALGIAGFLVWNALRIAETALDVLMDRELPDDDRARVVALVLAHPQARGLHDLRTRSTGVGQHIDFHLELDSDLTLAEAHDITDEIELRLREAFPSADFSIHQEPEGLDDDRLDNRIAEARAAARSGLLSGR
ncbi:cation diffusion facilitator family transporter [Rhodospirillum centenum]|uniref:Cation efflux family protein n=1 Tax=Rhodospirillum centenum (strain ATCC 51521 / SW) TaxID=414684 RepID=B6IRD5_RHOCS|nr:cation diffusion facilitator family transporter [Rhodospirillum centenum]ACI98021.1 cation efflux family protein [Rhodospirillum centenum SW]